MSDLITILNTIRDGIAGDSAIDTWCRATYGQGHKVFVGIDPNSPPADPDLDETGKAIAGTGQYPCIALSIGGKTEGVEQLNIPHRFRSTLGLYDDSRPGDTDTNILQYAGATRIEEFRALVDAALVKAVATLENHDITEAEMDFSPVTLFPWFLCDMDFTVVETQEFRSDSFG
jgi:hypothetical protein